MLFFHVFVFLRYYATRNIGIEATIHDAGVCRNVILRPVPHCCCFVSEPSRHLLFRLNHSQTIGQFN